MSCFLRSVLLLCCLDFFKFLSLFSAEKRIDKRSELLISSLIFFTSKPPIKLISNMVPASTVIWVARLLNFGLLVLNSLILVLDEAVVFFVIWFSISFRYLIWLCFGVNKMKMAWPLFCLGFLSCWIIVLKLMEKS